MKDHDRGILASTALRLSLLLLLTGIGGSEDVYRKSASADDTARTGWRYRRRAHAQDDRTPYVALIVPPEVIERSQPRLADARLIDSTGREIPYVIDRQAEKREERRQVGRLIDTRQERRRQTQWTLDFGEMRRFDTLELDIQGKDFAKSVRIEAARDGNVYETLVADAGVFDRDWNPPIRHTRISLPEAAEARQVRLIADDRRSAPIRVTGVTAISTRHVPGEQWKRRVIAAPLGSAKGVSRYRLDIPPGWPAESFSLETTETAFARIVRVIESDPRRATEEPAETVLAEGRLYRLRLPDLDGVGESLTIDLKERGDGELILEIVDSDSPPLRGVAGVLSAARMRLLFARSTGAWTLYYGNPRTHAPLYDIATLEEQFRFVERFSLATLEAETRNPRYRPEPSLPFAPVRGAALDSARWRYARRFTLAGSEDLRSLLLDPLDVSVLRRDAGDVRLVNGESLQVPFILELDAVTAAVDLTIEHLRNAGAAERATSRYRLVTPIGPERRPCVLPLTSLKLEFKEAFFARRMRVDIASDGTPRTKRRPFRLFTGLVRRGENDHGEIVVALRGSLTDALALEIDEGDNAPLTLTRARAVLGVPRLTFQAGPGEYHLLMGNPRASAPQYDLATLRDRVLALSADAVQAEPLRDNPLYRRSLADLAHTSPPTLLLWTVLVLAVLTLLMLTIRIVRRSEI